MAPAAKCPRRAPRYPRECPACRMGSLQGRSGSQLGGAKDRLANSHRKTFGQLEASSLVVMLETEKQRGPSRWASVAALVPFHSNRQRGFPQKKHSRSSAEVMLRGIPGFGTAFQSPLERALHSQWMCRFGGNPQTGGFLFSFPVQNHTKCGTLTKNVPN